MSETWPPESIEAAEDEALILSSDVAIIQAQLAHKNRLGDDGLPMADRAYAQWRSRAIYALNRKLVRLWKLKAWIKAANIEAARIEAGVVRPGNAAELMGCLMKALREAVDELTPREKALLTLAQRWIQTKGAPAIVKAKETALGASA